MPQHRAQSILLRRGMGTPDIKERSLKPASAAAVEPPPANADRLV
jgi:hypothetical protein